MHAQPVTDTGLACDLEHDIQLAESEIAGKCAEVEQLYELATEITLEVMSDYRWVTRMSEAGLRLITRGRNSGSKL
jgi:hypothetical protein